MKELVYIFLGSGLGGLTRYGLGKWINTFHHSDFPFGTFVVNLLACFVLGFVVGLAENRQVISSQTRLFWVVGFCGGFSTFSTFSNESLQLIQSASYLINLVYIFASVLFCILFTYLGMIVGGRI